MVKFTDLGVGNMADTCEAGRLMTDDEYRDASMVILERMARLVPEERYQEFQAHAMELIALNMGARAQSYANGCADKRHMDSIAAMAAANPTGAKGN